MPSLRSAHTAAGRDAEFFDSVVQCGEMFVSFVFSGWMFACEDMELVFVRLHTAWACVIVSWVDATHVFPSGKPVENKFVDASSRCFF